MFKIRHDGERTNDTEVEVDSMTYTQAICEGLLPAEWNADALKQIPGPFGVSSIYLADGTSSFNNDRVKFTSMEGDNALQTECSTAETPEGDAKQYWKDCFECAIDSLNLDNNVEFVLIEMDEDTGLAIGNDYTGQNLLCSRMDFPTGPSMCPEIERITINQPIVINKFKTEILAAKSAFEADESLHGEGSALRAFFQGTNFLGNDIYTDRELDTLIDYIRAKVCDAAEYDGTICPDVRLTQGKSDIDSNQDMNTAFNGVTDDTSFGIKLIFKATSVADSTTALAFAESVVISEEAAPIAERQVASSVTTTVAASAADDDDDAGTEIAIIVGASLAVVLLAFLAWQYNRRKGRGLYASLAFTPEELNRFGF